MVEISAAHHDIGVDKLIAHVHTCGLSPVNRNCGDGFAEVEVGAVDKRDEGLDDRGEATAGIMHALDDVCVAHEVVERGRDFWVRG